MLQFQNPSILYALPVLLVPLIIHLLNLQRTKKIVFSNVRFVADLKKRTQKKSKVKHWAILIARMLFLFFLVIAFAQPFITSDEVDSSQNNNVHVIYLDNSFSMSQKVSDRDLLHRAIAHAERLSELLPDNNTYHLLTNDFSYKDFQPLTNEEFNDKLSEIRLTSESKSFSQVVNRIGDIPEINKSGNIYLLSDFQKSTIGKIASEIDSTININLIPITATGQSNVFIDSIWLKDPFIKMEGNNELTVRVKNTTDSEKRAVSVKLYLDSVQVGTSSIDVAPDSYIDNVFNFQPSGNNFIDARVEIEDYPVTFDNNLYFIIRAGQKVTVVSLNQEKDSYIKAMYEQEPYFNYTSMSIESPDYEKLGNTDLLILNELSTISETIVALSRELLDRGASIWVIPSINSDITQLNGFYRDLEAPIRYSSFDTSSVSVKNEIKLPQKGDPFFQDVFEDSNGKVNMPFIKPPFVIRSNTKSVLLDKLNNIVVGRANVESGKIYATSTPLKDPYTNLHQHALFVPLGYKIAMNSITGSPVIYERIDDITYTFKSDDLSPGEPVKLIKQDIEVVPQQRVQLDELIYSLPSGVMEPGHYKWVHKENRISETAFNFSKDESFTASWSLRDIRDQVEGNNKISIFDENKLDNYFSDLETQRYGVPLWKYSLILSLIFIFAEIILIRYWA